MKKNTHNRQQIHRCLCPSGNKRLLPTVRLCIYAPRAKNKNLVCFVRSNIHLTGFKSLAKLYASMKRGYLTHVPFTVEDVRRAMALKPIDSVAEVAVRQGKRTNRPVLGLKRGNYLRDRAIVLHGDNFFISTLSE
jgi:hypothetical protein